MSLERCQDPILSEAYRDFIVSELQQDLFKGLFPGEVCRQETRFFYDIIYVSSEFADPIRFDKYPYNSVPKCYTLLDIEALGQAGIIQVQNYPTLELMGSGVLLGFVDTGIDYQNPIFQNLDGSTRIVGIWDQTIQEGTPPENMFYGTEYTGEQINEALSVEEPFAMVPSRDEDGHGTFLASIATGGANEENQ